jgi:tetratricopeptide (TPR) repeat protein
MWISWSFWTETLGPHAPKSLVLLLRNSWSFWSEICNIYRSSSYPQFDEITLPYKQIQKGILFKIAPKNELFSSGIFDVYSYRGMYQKFCLQDPKRLALITCYPSAMVNQANDLSNAGKLEDALRLYKLALLFPVDKPEADIYFDMSIVYNKMKDYDNELDSLANAVKRNNNLLPAIERAGLLYYDCGILPLAKDMFTRAVELGNTSEKVKKALDNINSLNAIEQYEYGLNKANDYLLKKDLKKAMNIYNFLLDKNYKAAVIHRNIGLFYIKYGNFPEALTWFLRSKNEAQSPEAIYYTAYAYYRMNDIKSALKELVDGLKMYNNDKDLNDLYYKLKNM